MESSSSRDLRGPREARVRPGDAICGREVATRLKRPRAGARNYWVLLERKGISVKQGRLSRSRCDFDGIVVAQNFFFRLALGFHVRIVGAPVLFTTLAAYSREFLKVLLLLAARTRTASGGHNQRLHKP